MVDRDVLIAKYDFANLMHDNAYKFQEALKMAAVMCQVKSAFISLLGNSHQDILSQTGIQLEKMDVKHSICQYTIQGTDLFMIPNTGEDDRVSHLGLHKSKHQIVFYAGQPLYNYENECIGAFCISHDKPKTLDNNQQKILSILASSFMKELDYQRKLINLIVNMDADFQVENQLKVVDLEIQLSKLQTKTMQQNIRLKRQHESLKETNENLKTFAYIAAHDIKAPARAIYSFAQLIQAKLKPSEHTETVTKYSDIIKSASKNLINLVSSILSYSETESKEFEMKTINLNKIIDIVKINLSELIETKNGTITCFDDPIYVDGQKVQLVQLFQNLIGNALKFQDGSKTPEVIIDYQELKDKYVISVTDNGIGIDQQNLYKIFEPFQRLHSTPEYIGSGLGLSTCLKVIENHKSHICIESNKSEGTRFSFTLPKVTEVNNEAGERKTECSTSPQSSSQVSPMY